MPPRKEIVAQIISWSIGIGLLTIFIAGLFIIASPFIEGIAWSIVVVLMTWPLYQHLTVKWRVPQRLTALFMTLGFTSMFLVLAIPLLFQFGNELYLLSQQGPFTSKEFTKHLMQIPIVGSILSSGQFSAQFDLLFQRIGELSLQFTGKATRIFIDSIFNIGIMLFSSYFLFCHGRQLLEESQSILSHYSGLSWPRIFSLAGETVKGVVYGALSTAIAQATLAGVGFYFVGAPGPTLLGFATLLMSLVPFGTPLVYVPVSLYMIFIADRMVAGIGLMFWGVMVISTIDNILRPLFISQSMRLPLLLVFIGVVGGILAFGLIGLFIGPVLVALGHAAWKELTKISIAGEKTSSANLIENTSHAGIK